MLLVVVGFTAVGTLVWRLRTARPSSLPSTDGWLVITLIAVIVLIMVTFGVMNLFTGVVLRPLDATLPRGYSRWQTSAWEAADPSEAELFIGRARHSAIMACWHVGTLVCGVVCAVGGGVILAVLGSDLWLGRQEFVTLLMVTGLLVVWIIAADMLRARRRSEVRRVVQRIGLSIVLTWLGGVILRMPSYLFYKRLGYPGFAFEIGWHDVLANATVFLVCSALGAMVIGVCWLLSPRLSRYTRSGFAMGLTLAAAAMVIAGLSASVRQAQVIATEQTTTARGTRYPACLTVNGADQPIWLIGQTARQLLIGDRPIIDPAHAKISRLRIVPGNLPYRVVNPEEAC